jgi:hypothetical protein
VKRPLLVVLLLFGAIGTPMSASSADTAAPVSVDGICGKLVSIEDVSVKGATNSVHEIVKPFEHTRVRLFSPTGSADCCSLITPLAEVTTGRDGSFQFKKQTPGDYWVVATLGGAEYKLLIRYEPVKKVSTDCSQALYALRNGKFQLQRTVTVTVD